MAWPGWTSTPRIGDRHLVGAERLVLDLAELRAVERVGATRAEALDVEQRGALADLLVGREGDRAASGAAARDGRRGARPPAMISATPALSSAPSSVSPLAVTMSWPSLLPARASRRGRGPCRRGGAQITPPSYPRWTIGSTPRPGASGLVSMCAIRPIASASPPPDPGSVATTYPFSSSARPPSPASSARRPAAGRGRAGPACSARRCGRGATACRSARSAGSGRARRARAPRRKRRGVGTAHRGEYRNVGRRRAAQRSNQTKERD